MIIMMVMTMMRMMIRNTYIKQYHGPVAIAISKNILLHFL